LPARDRAGNKSSKEATAPVYSNAILPLIFSPPAAKQKTSNKPMQKHQYLFPIMICFTLFLAGCGTRRDAPSSPRIVSLRENYPALLDEAQKWEADAYLDHATIMWDPYTTHIISAGFFSPSNDLESFGTYLMPDDAVTTEVFTHGYQIYQHAPIVNDDWSLDSQDALEFFWRDDRVQLFIQSVDKVCGYLKLERLLRVDDQPVVWSVLLLECGPSRKYIDFYLDPITGEVHEFP
jgi:hypothetical protein